MKCPASFENGTAYIKADKVLPRQRPKLEILSVTCSRSRSSSSTFRLSWYRRGRFSSSYPVPRLRAVSGQPNPPLIWENHVWKTRRCVLEFSGRQDSIVPVAAVLSTCHDLPTIVTARTEGPYTRIKRSL